MKLLNVGSVITVNSIDLIILGYTITTDEENDKYDYSLPLEEFVKKNTEIDLPELLIVKTRNLLKYQEN